jgi:protein-disulfide isomerase
MSAFVTCALLSVVIFEAVFIQVTIWNLQANAASAPSTEALLTAYNAAPIQEINVREDDPRIGSPEAPVQMVVFSDFQCPACKAFKKDLADVLSRHGDTTSVVFKHFPLDHACNDWVESEFHPMACAAAFATEAAREQGLFWPLHDLLFEAKLEGGVGQIRELAGKAGLNLERYDAAMNGDTGRIRVAEDIESGQALDMPGTPSIFINGKFLNSLSADSIGAVIESLVKDQ